MPHQRGTLRLPPFLLPSCLQLSARLSASRLEVPKRASLPAPDLPVCPSESHLPMRHQGVQGRPNLRTFGHRPRAFSLYAQLWQRVVLPWRRSEYVHSGVRPPAGG